MGTGGSGFAAMVCCCAPGHAAVDAELGVSGFNDELVVGGAKEERDGAADVGGMSGPLGGKTLGALRFFGTSLGR